MADHNALAPEARELAEKLATLTTLETQLVDRELELATLQADLAGFEKHYMHVVGERYAELDGLLAEIAEIKAQRHPHDFRAQENAKQARSQAQESAKNISVDSSGTAKDTPVFKVSDELKKLFRDAIQRIHPALSTVSKERTRRSKLMAEATQAYTQLDQAQLGTLIHTFTPVSDPEAAPGAGPGPALARANRKITQIEERLTGINAAVAEIKIRFQYKLFQKVEKATAAGRDLLVEMNWETIMKISEAREELAILHGTRKD